MNPKENLSPKRKQPNGSGKLFQTSIDIKNSSLVLSKSKSTPVIATPPKNTTNKQNQQLQTAIDALVQKIDTQTNMIAGLQVSVDSMKGAVQQNTVTVADSVKESRATYADIAKKGMAQIETTRSTKFIQTPKTSKPMQTPKSSKPVITGTSTNLIGKPLLPPQRKRVDRPKPEKAVWISRIHRDTTEEELTKYIKESIGIAPAEFEVRKLVKKGRDIATYSFISFYVACTKTNFDRLMNPMYWPSNSQIREFELEQQSSTGAKLNPTSQQMEASKNVHRTPKNWQLGPSDNQIPKQSMMDTV